MKTTRQPPFTGSATTLPTTAGTAVGSSEKTESQETVLAPPDEQPQVLKIEEAPARQLGFAIVGLGKLALEEVMPAFGECKLAKPVALVSGHREKAVKVAHAHHIPESSIYNYENFDRIADDPSIDVVYIILPNSMHAEFTIRALKAGKHVLCEKPMAVSVEEGQSMARAGREAGKKLGIAYRLHYEPLNMQVMKWCREKKFGKIKSFVSSNCQIVEAPNIRLSRELGGGPVSDTGIYSINAARYCIGEEPIAVTAVACFPDDDPRFREVPESVSFILTYPSGVIATCDTSFGTIEGRRYRVQCDNGYIEMDPSFSYRGLKLKTKALLEGDESSEVSEINLRQKNHFAEQMDGFCKAIINDTEVVTPASMGIADLRIIAAIRESYESGKPVKIDS
ncbi:MAG: Gfo/Idh/MocA family oxidoreductase [Luteolibacter sp.]|uniref:Gfo/Idh/MocA family protein n=1 Tax=Luteolibacter sp. TaxID=1962973 RepID=UPI0032645ABB